MTGNVNMGGNEIMNIKPFVEDDDINQEGHVIDWAETGSLVASSTIQVLSYTFKLRKNSKKFQDSQSRMELKFPGRRFWKIASTLRFFSFPQIFEKLLFAIQQKFWLRRKIERAEWLEVAKHVKKDFKSEEKSALAFLPFFLL